MLNTELNSGPLEQQVFLIIKLFPQALELECIEKIFKHLTMDINRNRCLGKGQLHPSVDFSREWWLS